MATPGGILPVDVRSQIHAWQCEIPGQRWVVNATGGLKLMSAGALEFAGRDDMAVVYRELSSGDWFSLTRDGEGTLVAEQITIPTSDMDAVPVDALIRAFWQVEGFKVEIPQGGSTDPSAIELIRAGIDSRWDWRETFRGLGANMTSEDSAGFLFERFVAMVVRSLGVHNLACNVRRLSAEGIADQEIDLVVNHGGRICVIDCKLRTAEEEGSRVEGLMSQIRQASDTRRRLGGLGTGLMLLRPNRLFTEAERFLATQASLTVLDAELAPRLISELAKFLRTGPIPEELREAEAEIIAARERGNYPFACSRTGSLGLIHSESNMKLCRAVANLDVFREELMQNWVGWILGGAFEFRCANPGGLNSSAFEQRVRQIFDQHWGGELSEVQVSNKGGTCRFRFVCPRARRSDFESWLETRIGKPLLVVD